MCNGLTGLQVAEVISHAKTASQAADVTATVQGFILTLEDELRGRILKKAVAERPRERICPCSLRRRDSIPLSSVDGINPCNLREVFALLQTRSAVV